MGIGNKEKNFQRYLERHFGLRLPKDVELFYTRGVRVGNAEIKKSTIHGELGYAACDFGFAPTFAFIQNFGYLAQRNVVWLGDSEAFDFAAGRDIRMDMGTKNKYMVIHYKQHTLGLGYYDAKTKKLQNKMPKKRGRQIVNNL